MKLHIVILLCLQSILSIGHSDTFNSASLNYGVWALVNTHGRVYTPVDVNMDGVYDVFFYGDLDSLVQNQSQAHSSQLYVVTANDVSVSCFNIPVGPGPDGEPQFIAAFTTFTDTQSIGPNLGSSLLSWESGDLSFHGFDIAGGIPSRDSYLGVQIRKGTDVFYGWIRLIFPESYDYFDESGYVKIKESAYEASPSTPIITGVGKTELPDSFSNAIRTIGNNTIEIEISGIQNLACMLQESIDLENWDSISADYATQANLKKNISSSNTPKFYRWLVSENFEGSN